MTDCESSDGNNSNATKADLMRLGELDRVTHFPLKLWDVVDDGACDIFRWSADGHSFYVDDVRYENEIMERYPGFVQISSFANLRRLLREYSFTWKNNEAGEFEFSHPCFLKTRKELLPGIKTKRKSLQSNTGNASRFRRRPSGSDGRASKHASCNWMQPVATGAVRLRMDTLMRFPEKLWAVVNDPNDLLYWGEEGKSVIVDDKKFEEEVMQRYPGFVQIAAFANLRRLLREYGFSWSIRDNGFFEFSHPCLTKGRPDLVSGVKTKRKAVKSGAHHPYLPYYRMDPPVHSHQNGYGDVPYDTYANHHMQMPASASPEVNQAVGSIQSASSSEMLFAPEQAIRNTQADCQHATGDHVHMQHQHLYSPAAALNYRYMPCHMAPAMNYWSVQQGSGDKVDAPVYYYSDHLNYAGMHGEQAQQQFQASHAAAAAAALDSVLPGAAADESDCQGSPSSSQSTLPSASNHNHEGSNMLGAEADADDNSSHGPAGERSPPLNCSAAAAAAAASLLRSTSDRPSAAAVAALHLTGLQHHHVAPQQQPSLLPAAAGSSSAAAASPGLSNSYSNLYMMHHQSAMMSQMFYPHYAAAAAAAMPQMYHPSYAAAGAAVAAAVGAAVRGSADAGLKQEPLEDNTDGILDACTTESPPICPGGASRPVEGGIGAAAAVITVSDGSAQVCCPAEGNQGDDNSMDTDDEGGDNDYDDEPEVPATNGGNENSVAQYGSDNDDGESRGSRSYTACNDIAAGGGVVTGFIGQQQQQAISHVGQQHLVFSSEIEARAAAGMREQYGGGFRRQRLVLRSDLGVGGEDRSAGEEYGIRAQAETMVGHPADGTGAAKYQRSVRVANTM